MANQYDMQNKIALVTGGASGIGEACVRLLLDGGATVVIADRNIELAEKLKAQLHAFSDRIRIVEVDVADSASVSSMGAQIRHWFGRLDVAINSAGIIGVLGSMEEMTLANFEYVMAVNSTGIFRCMQEEIALMRAAGGGAIVNLASMAGMRGFAGSSAYCASKHAVVGLTKVAGLELADQGIRVNAVCPMPTKTPLHDEFFKTVNLTDEDGGKMLPMKRLGLASEAAALCVWLCSSDSSFSTAQAIPFCGGASATVRGADASAA